MDKKPEKLVPEVRFKGFTDDWEQHKLGEISFKVNTKNKENLTLPVLSNSAEYGIVNQEDYFDKKIANRTDNYYIVKHNDFVYNPRISKKAPYGPIRRNTLDTKGLMSPLYYVFRINDGNYIYLDYYFKSSKWYKFMYQNGDSGARSDRFAIKDKIFQMMPISMPNTKEQNKIGQLIQTLQKLIDLQQRKLNQLKRLKTAMLQQLFTDKNSKQPNLRFKNFRGDWEQRKLKSVVSVNSGKDYKSLEKGNVPVYGTGGYITSVSKFLSSQDAIGLGRKGTINKPYILKAPFWTVDTLFYLTLKPENILTFIYSLIQKINWLQYDESTGLPSLSKKNIENVLVSLTKLDEQQKIGKVIVKLDKFITLQQSKIDQLTILKKYLLQKLFI